MKIYAQNGGSLTRQERLDLATLLVKAGYSVRLGKAKIDGKATEYVEFSETVPFHTIEQEPKNERAVEDASPYKEGEHGASE